MKVRWTEQSVRLRITPAELERLRHNQSVTETLRLPGGGWSIAIQPGDAHTSLNAAQGVLTLAITASDVERLATPDTEGVYFKIGSIPPLTYYIEKDFPCIHPRSEEAQEPPSETFMPR